MLPWECRLHSGGRLVQVSEALAGVCQVEPREEELARWRKQGGRERVWEQVSGVPGHVMLGLSGQRRSQRGKLWVDFKDSCYPS